MNSREITTASKKSVKWSLLTEFFAKISAPLSTAILARLLAPEIFGITAAITIVVSFCEAITDTGFAKFIIQHDFNDDDEYKKYLAVSVAFSLGLSAILFALIVIFRYPISTFIGNSGYESVLVISSLQLPFFALNSIFIAHLRRKFKFNQIFVFRIIYCLAPFIITIPLAFLKMGPWALVVGAIAAQALQTPFLLIKCRKYIRFYFSFKLLLNTIKLSYLIIIESIIIWMSTWLLTFISAQYFSSHIVGIVKVANSTINNIFALFSTSFTSVLFATLSRLKNDDTAFKNNFYSIQSCAFTLIIPLGIGCYFYSDIITKVLLGNQWMEASKIIAILAVADCLRICFNNFVSEVFRAKGHFLSSIIYHLFALVVNIVFKLTLGRNSLDMFIWTTVISYAITMIVAIMILQFRYKFSISKQISSLLPTIVCCLFMIPGLLLAKTNSYHFMQSIAQVVFCASCYFSAGFLIYKPIFKNSLSYLGFDKLLNKKKVAVGAK